LPDGLANSTVSSAFGEYGATNGPMMATSVTADASPSPMPPRGVRTAVSSSAAHWCRRRRLAGGLVTRVAAGGLTDTGYLATLRRGVASRAMTSAMMFTTT